MVWVIPPLQVAIMFISLLLYGFGPIGVDLYKRSSMVSCLMIEHLFFSFIIILIIILILIMMNDDHGPAQYGKLSDD